MEGKGIETAVERGHFVRAALMAEQADLSRDEIQGLRYKAIWQMAAEYRNVHGTKRLALRYGLSREDVRKILEDFSQRAEKENSKVLDPCYDYITGRHIPFGEWLEGFMKLWKKLPA